VVRAYCRRTPAAGLLPASVDVTVGDLLDIATLRRALRGINVVFHLAAQLHVTNPTEEVRPKYERVNVEGTRLLVSEAQRAGVSRVVLFSTISVYGEGNGSTWTEETTARPATPYAATKRQSEIVALEALRDDGVPLCTVLRLGAVYGPRLKGNYRRLLEGLAAHHFLPIGRGENRRALIFTEDVARAALLSAGCPLAAGRIFNVADERPHTLESVVRSMCQALGRNPPRWRIPDRVADFTAGIVDGSARFLRLPFPSAKATLAKYREDLIVSVERARNVLGFSAEIEMDEGWLRTVRAMRRSGLLR
jgi:UDP-glucose 4-epimerase